MARRHSILVVDDEPGICELLSEALKLNGYEVRTAVNGRDGYDQAVMYQPDLVLLDVMMPIWDGWQALEHLQRNPRTEHIPVIMLTAKSETESVFRSQERKVVDYFIKPIVIKELLTYLHRYFDLQALDKPE